VYLSLSDKTSYMLSTGKVCNCVLFANLLFPFPCYSRGISFTIIDIFYSVLCIDFGTLSCFTKCVEFCLSVMQTKCRPILNTHLKECKYKYIFCYDCGEYEYDSLL